MDTVRKAHWTNVNGPHVRIFTSQPALTYYPYIGYNRISSYGKKMIVAKTAMKHYSFMDRKERDWKYNVLFKGQENIYKTYLKTETGQIHEYKSSSSNLTKPHWYMTKGSNITQRIKSLGGVITLFPKQRLASITIDTFLCDDVIYRGQDFAGAPLEPFPMVEIFQLYNSNQQAAFEKFHRWMREWLFVLNGWKIPKRKWGMAKGSLYTLISELYRDKYQCKLRDFDRCDRQLVNKAIALRARHYFVDVYESIKNKGYDVSMGSPITCVGWGDAYMIKNGHHRTATLLVLCLETVMARPI